MSLVEPLYSPLAVRVCAVLASVFVLLILLVLYWSGGGELTSSIGRQLTSRIGGQLPSGTSGTKETIFTSSAVVFGLMLTLREYSKLTASTSISSSIEKFRAVFLVAHRKDRACLMCSTRARHFTFPIAHRTCTTCNQMRIIRSLVYMGAVLAKRLGILI